MIEVRVAVRYGWRYVRVARRKRVFGGLRLSIQVSALSGSVLCVAHVIAVGQKSTLGLVL